MQKNIIYPKVTFWDISKALWGGVKPYKWSLFFLLLVVTMVNIIASLIPLFYKQFFDVITLGSDKSIIAHSLIRIIINIAILNGVIWALYRSYAFCNNNFQASVMARLRQQAYDYLMQHSYGFFTNNFTGSLVQRVNRFARAFERMADRILWDILTLFIKVTSIIIIVFFINKWVALVILIWAIIFLLFNIIFSIWK